MTVLGGPGCSVDLRSTPPGGPDAFSVALGSTPRRSETAATTPGAAAGCMHENAGASGYVDENTGERPGTVSTKCPPVPSQAPWEASPTRPEPQPSGDTWPEKKQAPVGAPARSVLPANERAASANPRPEAA